MGQLKHPPSPTETLPDHDADSPQPDDAAAALAAFGLAPAHPLPGPDEGGTVWLWSDNVATWAHWCNLHTQWRHAPAGMGGSRPTGLDDAAVIAYLQCHGYRSGNRKRSLRQAFGLIQACEAGALDGFARLEQKQKT
jgi:Phage related hypothetical protein (DUF1799)